LNQFVPLALVLLGPVIVNILMFHTLVAPSGLGMAAALVVLWAIIALRHKNSLGGIFDRSAAD
jgi:uncharacterized membrane protein YwaF